MSKAPKIIYFIEGPLPSEDDRAKAAAFSGVKVVFRNAQPVFEVCEDCDGVAGAIPDCYAKFPNAETACAEYLAEVKALSTEYAEIAGGAAPVIDENSKTGAKVAPGENDNAEAQQDAPTGDAATPGTASAWQANKG